MKLRRYLHLDNLKNALSFSDSSAAETGKSADTDPVEEKGSSQKELLGSIQMGADASSLSSLVGILTTGSDLESDEKSNPKPTKNDELAVKKVPDPIATTKVKRCDTPQDKEPQRR